MALPLGSLVLHEESIASYFPDLLFAFVFPNMTNLSFRKTKWVNMEGVMYILRGCASNLACLQLKFRPKQSIVSVAKWDCVECGVHLHTSPSCIYAEYCYQLSSVLTGACRIYPCYEVYI